MCLFHSTKNSILKNYLEIFTYFNPDSFFFFALLRITKCEKMKQEATLPNNFPKWYPFNGLFSKKKLSAIFSPHNELQMVYFLPTKIQISHHLQKKKCFVLAFLLQSFLIYSVKFHKVDNHLFSSSFFNSK